MSNAETLTALNEQLALNQQAKVLIVGLGKTGFSVAKFLQQHAIPCAVIDSRNTPPLKDALLQHHPDIPVFTNGFDQSVFAVATHIVVSPGISLHQQQLQQALPANSKIISDIDLFACAARAPIVAITGSNGKSTVTSMLGDMGNRAAIKTAVGGNLGVPALALLDPSVALYVLELSSFQLERSSVLNATAATVLNLSADHLDRHGSANKYAAAKQKVFAGNGIMVLNEDDQKVCQMALADRKIMRFSLRRNSGFHCANREGERWLLAAHKPLLKRSELPLEGEHNVANALSALALGTAVGINAQAMASALRDFKGLAHRMQCIGKVKGVTWVNDSKATNVGACVAALQSYQNKIVLIAGGDSKGAQMSELIPALKAKAKCVILTGKDSAAINTAINGCVPARQASSIKEAVQLAAQIAQQGESVLLSPACASLDQFKNYQERGEQFIAAVRELSA